MKSQTNKQLQYVRHDDSVNTIDVKGKLYTIKWFVCSTSMSFPIVAQSSVVILQESSRGEYSKTVYTILLFCLDHLW